MPPLNQQKRERKAALQREFELVAALMRDSSARRAVERFDGLPREPMSVWTDSDQTWPFTELGPNHLPKWEELTEFIKMFVGFDIGMEFGVGYSFTTHILPSILTRWDAAGADHMENIEQRLRRELGRVGLERLPRCYVVETRTRSGKTRTRPHLHGYCLCNKPTDATLFKVALERAFNPGLRRLGKRSAVLVEQSYDFGDEFIGRAQWVKYMAKNVDRWDSILGRRRLYFSRPLQRMIRDAWGIRREE